MEKDDDAGQVTVLAATGLALAVVMLLAMAAMGRALAERAQARTAADAAALAGAADGEAAAERLAEANHAEVVRYDEVDGTVVVEVTIGRVNAFARARSVPVAPQRQLGGTAAVAGTGTGKRAGLTPEMAAALGRADRLLGTPVPIASGLRTRAQQQSLWDRRHLNPYPVARPGTSNHETGRAVDVPRQFVPRLLAVSRAAGLCQPMPRTDPVHFVVCR